MVDSIARMQIGQVEVVLVAVVMVEVMMLVRSVPSTCPYRCTSPDVPQPQYDAFSLPPIWPAVC